MVSLILLCAGEGSRTGFEKNKIFKALNGVTVFEKCLSAFVSSQKTDEYIICYSQGDLDELKKLASPFGLNVKFVAGGKTRAESVSNGLNAVSGNVVLIHDCARPFVTEKIISDCVESAENFGSGVTAIPAIDTVLSVDEKENVILSSNRKALYFAQTPQAFKTELIKKAYSQAKDLSAFTDDAGVFLKYIGNPHVVSGNITNKKLTYSDDFSCGDFFSGVGFDLHRLETGRKLILGGIEIPHDKGLLGHSDADVLCHAVMDALLSSAGLKDIGTYFPDTDEKYKDISSVILLEKVLDIISEKGYYPKSVSAVIMAEKPKLAPFVDKIRKNLANILKLDESAVGITCTTLEKIGTVGREEGIAVSCSLLSIRRNGNEQK